ncbi:MAG: methyltransferase domain-containing protein, partial [Nitrospinaceae bacterium]|nr:class I SAM-dependent methyltransferase [Nitrospinaceae bacterium]NIR57926.1 class I SAM-dependent methyltransferase [Nitrospinaceae bacterium]NIS88384.1 class I SAM-dependent methyltransferase [Nitrospinaceae bacterium]NIT85262.1 class I SAM-dependent methyltransferase [Nitrospinaceae bacterium]NIU47415.1 class I SAM-dependent methyltransferase [Nitrospinaceae bacterium]
PLCYSPSEFLIKVDRREYQLCTFCRLIFVPSRFFITPEKEIERYLEHENSLENEGYVQMFQEKIECIREYCPDVETVLDYGCGYEPVLKTLLERAGYQADGYDPYFFPDLKPDAGYDLVISTETFEHLKQPGVELSRILRLLNPRGWLGVMTQFYPTQNGLPDTPKFMHWYYRRDPTHICFYSAKTFEWIARHHNFDMIHNSGRDFVILRKNPSS